MKIVIHPRYENHRNALLQMVESFFKKGKVIVKGSRNIIKSQLLDDEDVNIKYFKKPDFLKAVIYSFFRKSKAERSYEYALFLLEHNIKTPFPIAFAEERTSLNLLGKSYYISEQIDYDFTFRELIHNPLFQDRNLILEQFTHFTFQMHEAGILFQDHSPGNTLIKKVGEGHYEFYLIDLNRMSFTSLTFQQRIENFKRLWLSKRMVAVMAPVYAALSGISEEKVFTAMLETSNAFKRKTARKKFIKRFIGK